VTQEIDRVRTRIRCQFLGSDVCYRTDEIEPGPTLTRSCGEHHRDQFLIPLRGQFLARIGTVPTASVIELQPGNRYRIPAGLTFSILASEGLIESFVPGAEPEKLRQSLLDEHWVDATIGPTGVHLAGQSTSSRSGRAAEPTASRLGEDILTITPVVVDCMPRTGASGSDGRVEIDIAVPGTSLGRKVYFAPPEKPRKLPYPHQHYSAHLLVGVSGMTWIALRELDQVVTKQQLTAGDAFTVPPGRPHQMLVEAGGIVASYFPAATWISREEELEQLDEDWFP
jgi:mannose-6-phosphate isomerase-like protein (cupin superfamily)